MHRDRHARVQRADGDQHRRPADGFRTAGRQRFRILAEDACALLPEAHAAHAAEARLVIRDVGGEQGGEPVLAGLDVGRKVLTVYRRPLEARAEDLVGLVEMIRLAVGAAIADAHGLAWDEGWEEEG